MDGYIHRALEHDIVQHFFKGRAIIVHGARQCGKTTLVKHLVKQEKLDPIWFTGDDDDDIALFATISASRWRQLLGNHRCVVIDEAQSIPHIERAVKLLVDTFPEVQPILTGSSSFQLANLNEEPLTGHKYEFFLYPLGFQELVVDHGLLQERKDLELRLLFGSYPAVLKNPDTMIAHLKELSDSYLYKDLLKYDGIRKPSVLRKLVNALAFQIGSEVSNDELSRLVGVSRPTVESYISLLEQAYVVFSLPSFSKNGRNEIKKGKKVYFWDVGVRNAILNDYTPIALRKDIGNLWENYLIAERLKCNAYRNSLFLPYFWRTAQQQEVDYVEAGGDAMCGWGFKWTGKGRRISSTFLNAYPQAETAVIDRLNYQDFLLP